MPLLMSARTVRAIEEPNRDQLWPQIDQSQVFQHTFVNRPDLLPSKQTPHIDLREVLTKSETRFVKVGTKIGLKKKNSPGCYWISNQGDMHVYADATSGTAVQRFRETLN